MQKKRKDSRYWKQGAIELKPIALNSLLLKAFAKKSERSILIWIRVSSQSFKCIYRGPSFCPRLIERINMIYKQRQRNGKKKGIQRDDNRQTSKAPSLGSALFSCLNSSYMQKGQLQKHSQQSPFKLRSQSSLGRCC